MKKNAIFICGPTASGKTGVAIKLAEWLKTEILSFDSRQFFAELKIGAAPPSQEELQRIPHHFIANRSIEQEYNAGEFEKDAMLKLETLFEKHDAIVCVGGSGMYMKALTDGFDEMPYVPPHFREELNIELREKGLEQLAKELEESDPVYYQSVDKNNPQRIIRALEVIRSTGKKYSDLRKDKKADRYFNSIKIGLNLPRPELYDLINRRVDKMMEEGLEQEVRDLIPFKDRNAMQTVGYREFYPYFNGSISKDEAIFEIKKNSRRYAKRQLTWFRRDETISWFHPKDIDAMKEHLKSELSSAE